MAEGFDFLKVRETGTKGSSFWRRSTKRRRVRIFARERDGDRGFEFSEPKTRFKISDSFGAQKTSFPYKRGNLKNASFGQLAYNWSLASPIAEGFDFLRVRGGCARRVRRVRLSGVQAPNAEGFDFLRVSETVTKGSSFRSRGLDSKFWIFWCRSAKR